MPDENGKTRRERNEEFDVEELTPSYELDVCSSFYFDLYFEISDRLRRVVEGFCSPIPPSEFVAWATLTNTVVYPWEYDILFKMDAAYCSEMNKELAAYRERLTKN